uniref:Uncharacterized protein n=1 Tax=Oryza meridionalis TaxID=40149 RepID=A0A0E0EK54_9ORYZ
MSSRHLLSADLRHRSSTGQILAPFGLPRRGELIFLVSPLFPPPKPTTTATSSCCRSCALVAAVPAILLSPSAFLHPPRVSDAREHAWTPLSRPFNHRSTDAFLPPSPLLYPAGRRRDEDDDDKKRLKEHLTMGPTFINPQIVDAPWRRTTTPWRLMAVTGERWPAALEAKALL